AEQGPRLHRLSQPHLETIDDELAPHPTPAGRRLDRYRRDAVPALLGPAGKAVPIRGEALLDDLTAVGTEHSRLERVLVDVDRRVQHHRPPLVDTEARSSSSAQDRALMTSKMRQLRTSKSA